MRKITYFYTLLFSILFTSQIFGDLEHNIINGESKSTVNMNQEFDDENDKEILNLFNLEGIVHNERIQGRYIPACDNFLVITPEKCGTFLIMKTLSRILNKDWRMYWERTILNCELLYLLSTSEEKNLIQQVHLFYNKSNIDLLQSKNYKIIYLMRDPRDQLVSMLFYIREKNWGFEECNMQTEFGTLSFDDQLMELITGERYGTSALYYMFGNRKQFITEDPQFLYVVHFENLVGENGGGSSDKQINEILNMIGFLNIDITTEEVIKRTKDIYGKPNEGTFRSGQIGEWRKYYSLEHINAFKSYFGVELIELGYENCFDW